MGKPTGFIEYRRLAEAQLPVAERLKNFREFVLHLSDEQAAIMRERTKGAVLRFALEVEEP